MNQLALYHALPSPLRSVVASGRGVQLAAWRYGPGFDDLVAEVAERDRWSATRWHQWRSDRLDRILHRAATRVPYYRNYWQARKRDGHAGDIGELANWPVLPKEAVRADPMAFLADDVDRRRMYPEHTSGTTGMPLSLWWSRPTSRLWFALFEARVRGWAGVDRQNRWANLAGQLVVPYSAGKPPYWVYNLALRQLYLSAHHLSADTALDYAAVLKGFEPRSIVGYPSAISSLATLITDAASVDPPPVGVAITTAEPVFDFQRASIASGLGASVRETYGQAETVAASSECAHGAMHWWPDVGIIEGVSGHDDIEDEVIGSAGRADQHDDNDGNDDNDHHPDNGDNGDRTIPMVVTGLLNPDMPLIRYELGDSLRPTYRNNAEPCRCGRTLPRWGSIAGRSDDMVIGAGGRAIGRLDTVFKASLPIRGAQIRQDADGSLEVIVVPSADFAASHRDEIEARLAERVGDLPIGIRLVDALPLDASGKFRAVIRREASSR